MQKPLKLLVAGLYFTFQLVHIVSDNILTACIVNKPFRRKWNGYKAEESDDHSHGEESEDVQESIHADEKSIEHRLGRIRQSKKHSWTTVHHFQVYNLQSLQVMYLNDTLKLQSSLETYYNFEELICFNYQFNCR